MHSRYSMELKRTMQLTVVSVDMYMFRLLSNSDRTTDATNDVNATTNWPMNVTVTATAAYTKLAEKHTIQLWVCVCLCVVIE